MSYDVSHKKRNGILKPDILDTNGITIYNDRTTCNN